MLRGFFALTFRMPQLLQPFVELRFHRLKTFRSRPNCLSRLPRRDARLPNISFLSESRSESGDSAFPRSERNSQALQISQKALPGARTWLGFFPIDTPKPVD